MNRTAAVLALGLVLAACAGASAAAEGAPQPRRNPNQLTPEELAQPAVSSLTLYDAIQRLRPSWLNQRGATSVMGSGDRFPQVMINESSSAMEVLRSMRPSDVTVVEFMSGADATTLYGTGYVNGLIRVRTGGVR
jgi:hypothetical protein